MGFQIHGFGLTCAFRVLLRGVYESIAMKCISNAFYMLFVLSTEGLPFLSERHAPHFSVDSLIFYRRNVSNMFIRGKLKRSLLCLNGGAESSMEIIEEILRTEGPPASQDIPEPSVSSARQNATRRAAEAEEKKRIAAEKSARYKAALHDYETSFWKVSARFVYQHQHASNLPVEKCDHIYKFELRHTIVITDTLN